MSNYTKLGTLTKIKTGKLDANASSADGIYPFFTCSREPLKINSYSYDCECVLVAGNGELNVKYYKGKFDAYQRTYIIEVSDNNVLLPKYLYYFLDLYVETLRLQSIGGIIKYIKLGNLTEAEIPLFSIEEQQNIVNQLDKCKNLIEQRKLQLQKLDNLVKSQFIEMFGDIPFEIKYDSVELGTIANMYTGGTPSSKHPEYYGGDIPFVSTPCLGDNYIDEKNAQNWLTELGVEKSAAHKIPPYSIMYGSRVGVGKSSINTCVMCTNQDVLSFCDIDKSKYNLLFIKKVLDQYFKVIDSKKRGATIKGVTADLVKSIRIPNVSIDIQNKFARFVEQTDKSKIPYGFEVAA